MYIVFAKELNTVVLYTESLSHLNLHDIVIAQGIKVWKLVQTQVYYLFKCYAVYSQEIPIIDFF